MSTNAILPQVFVGTHSCTYMVQNREDCVGVSSHRPNWAASRVHALMLHEGSVRTPGGHFFTFADACLVKGERAETADESPARTAPLFVSGWYRGCCPPSSPLSHAQAFLFPGSDYKVYPCEDKDRNVNSLVLLRHAQLNCGKFLKADSRACHVLAILMGAYLPGPPLTFN